MDKQLKDEDFKQIQDPKKFAEVKEDYLSKIEDINLRELLEKMIQPK